VRKGSPLRRIIIWVLIVVLAGPPAWVLAYRFVPPPITPLMAIRLTQGKGMDYRWRPLSKISPALVQAAVAGEDARFCEHRGFDVVALQAAMRHNERRPGRIRGGSTISQQTAKNAFLWPGRTFVRKAVEAYFTVLIEALWGKRRIMEVYLNIVEMGPGVYGAQAAAQHYFQVDANQLTNLQASRLAAIFPNPLKWRAVGPGRYVQKRSMKIGGAMGFVRNAGLDACVGRLSGVVPAAAPVLSAPPPAAAQAFVEQQSREEAPSPAGAPTAPDQLIITPEGQGSDAPASDQAPF
jgi:monofunctional biosynthetic peptidoglycan transglycosylase